MTSQVKFCNHFPRLHHRVLNQAGDKARLRDNERIVTNPATFVLAVYTSSPGSKPWVGCVQTVHWSWAGCVQTGAGGVSGSPPYCPGFSTVHTPSRSWLLSPAVIYNRWQCIQTYTHTFITILWYDLLTTTPSYINYNALISRLFGRFISLNLFQISWFVSVFPKITLCMFIVSVHDEFLLFEKTQVWVQITIFMTLRQMKSSRHISET